MSSLPRPLFRSFQDIRRSWFKRSWPSYLENKPTFEFTVASYNVLADKLLHDHPHLYFTRERQESWIFDWNYRKKNLLAEIRCSDADVSEQIKTLHLMFIQATSFHFDHLYKIIFHIMFDCMLHFHIKFHFASLVYLSHVWCVQKVTIAGNVALILQHY